MAITSQFNLEQGLRIVDDALYPVSMGKVSDTGMHIPDLDIIDGKNIIPTQAGYTSYFGKDRNIDDTVLASLKVQEIITYRTKHGDVIQLAFTNNGLYLSSLSGSDTAVRSYTAAVGSVPAFITIDLPAGKGDWIWVLGSTLGHASPWELWTYVLIENNLYIYYKGLKHIYKLYSVEPEQVLFDELDPSFIISTDKVWQFTINAEDRSEGDDTYKSVEFNTDSGIYLGTYSHPVDKAHQVWNIEQNVLAPFHTGLPARLDNLSKLKVDIDATITFSTSYDTYAIYRNGEPEELITTWDTYNVTQAFTGRNWSSTLVMEDITTGGTLTIDLGDPIIASVDIVIDGADTKADIITKIINGIEGFMADDDSKDYYFHVMHIIDLANDKDELSLEFEIVSIYSTPGGANSLFVSYTGTTSVLSMTNHDSGDGAHSWFNKLKPLYRINTLSGYTTYTEDEEVTVTIDGHDYTILATDSESSTSVLARLKEKILADVNFEEVVLETPDGSFNFTKLDPQTWDLGGVRTVPITVSNNIQLTSTENIAPGDSYDPAWEPEALEQVLTTLRLQGFKEYGLTSLAVMLNEVVYNIPISSIYDSNDIISLIYDTILLQDIGATIQIDQNAYAEADYDLIVNVPIFDGSTPSPTLDQDGTTLWTVDGGSTTSETVDLLQVDGIFYARGRLGYWTKENENGWSAINDPMDFVPSTVTRANRISIKAVKGDIVKVIGYEDGFIIYATGNVIQAKYVKDSVNVFTFTPIDNAPGLIDPRHLTSNASLQYYWHTTGLYVIDPVQGSVQEQLGEISDWLNRYRHPISIQMIGNRFLIVNLLTNSIQFSNRVVRNGGSTDPGIVDVFTGSPVEIEAPKWGANLYPTYKRAFIFDTKLKRWGTCDQDYLVLASLMPYNQSGYQADKDYGNISEYLDNQQRGLLILGTDGKLYITNDNPTDSYIVLGHYAVHRINRTKLIEAYLEFVKAPEATIEFEPSLDWSTIAWEYLKSFTISGLRARISPNISAYWINTVLRGRFHIKRGLIKGHQHGR